MSSVSVFGSSMDMLDWARGPLLHAALTVFVVGVAWRFFALSRLPITLTVAPARTAFSQADALGTALTRMWPRKGMWAAQRW